MSISSEQFSTLSKPLPDPLCLLNIDGQFLAANPAATDFLKLDKNTLYQKTLFQLVSDSRDKVEKNLRNWSRCSTMIPGPLKLNSDQGEIVHCNCEGSLVQKKTSNSQALIIVRFQRREVFSKSFTALNEKITLLQKQALIRKRTEDALAQSNAEFEAMFNSIPDAVMFLDTHQCIVKTNPAFYEMFGYDKQKLSGKTAEKIYANKVDFVRQTRANHHAKETTSGTYEIKFKHKNSETFWTETRSTLVKDKNNNMMGFIYMIRDITERKQTEEELTKYRTQLEEKVRERTTALESTNKELEAFSYSVSHDLRAPLRSIQGFSEILLEDNRDQLDDQGIDYLNRVCDGTVRMGNLIDDMLKLSRTTRTTLTRKIVNISEMAEDIIDRRFQQNSNRKIEIQIEPKLEAYADPNLLEIALENLIGNAWKFTSKKKDTKIEIGSHEKNGEQIFYVKDNGAGFNQKYAAKLFGAFQRLHKETDYPGTGIGLATVQRITHRHGGRIWAEADLNNGATFFFTLSPAK